MEAIKKKPHYTIEEYLVAEAKAKHKSEYYNGEIVAMAGGSPMHSRISVKTTSALDNALKGKNCNTYKSGNVTNHKSSVAINIPVKAYIVRKTNGKGV